MRFSLLMQWLGETVAIIGMWSLIPLIVVSNSENCTIKDFLRQVGIYPPPRSRIRPAIIILFLASALALSISILALFLDQSSIKGSGTDISTCEMLIFLLLHGVRTGIGEEIFFRGFLAKQFISRLGFLKGNLLQASIFGLVHVMHPGTAIGMVRRFLVAAFLGYIYGYVMAKKCKGSIVPTIAAHGLHNIIASIVTSLVYYHFILT